MHVPDGFFNTPTSVGTGAIAVAAIGVSLTKARRELTPTTAPIAAATSALVFAGQMVNFPVTSGTSGHLIGAAVLAAVVGPWSAVLCLSTVLMVQAVLFADGGLSAAGTNIVLMPVIAVAVSAGIYRAVLRRTTNTPALIAAAAAAGLASVPIAAFAFAVLHSIGGTTSISLGAIAADMVGTHLLIGIGEGILTAATVGVLLAVRPEAAWIGREALAHDLRRSLDTPTNDLSGSELVDAAAHSVDTTSAQSSPATAAATGGVVAVDSRSAVRVTGAIGAVAIVTAGVLSYFASAMPDGLESVAERLGFDTAATSHALGTGPFADYTFAGIDNAALSGGLAGVIGVAAVGIVTYAITRALAATRRSSNSSTA